LDGVPSSTAATLLIANAVPQSDDAVDEALPASVSDDHIAQGTVIEHFRVMRLLGHGGMGAVYLARDLHLGRKVALKIVHNELIERSDEIMQRFLFEARTTAKFSHPHIVTIFAVGQFRSRPFVALEYLEGQNLRERMQEHRLSLPEALRIVLAVAEATAEAHRHGILHRDLKPANVLIPRDGRVRVVDFGLAHELPSHRPTDSHFDGDVFVTDGRSARGTPAYMAPEQWLGLDVGPPADVWALGLMLFELCACRLPYEERVAVKLFQAVTSDDPVPALGAAADVPLALESLIADCLDKVAERRPSAAHVANGLREIVFESRQHAGDEESPFRGLLPFAERHSALFFGRDAEIASFVERLRQEPVVAVVGPSGAGKSSLIQAGVVPRLREQGRWLILRMRPGDRPLRRLAAKLVAAYEGDTGSAPMSISGELAPSPRLSPEDTFSSTRDRAVKIETMAAKLIMNPGLLALELQALASERGGRVLLYVDQAEEAFTLAEHEDAARAFLRGVCAAADDASDPVRVVFTVRDDFLGRLARVGPGVRDVLRHVMVLHSPDSKTLEEILTASLEVVGYKYDDPSVPAKMVASVDNATCLPLLQFAARRLWDQRDRVKRVLRSADYEEMGGVGGALIQHANALLGGLSAEELRLARALLLRLVTPERTRRVVAGPKLLEGLPAPATEVLGRLTQSRLVSVRKSGSGADAEAQHELAHESLVTNWTLLATWLDEGREGLVFLAEATQAAELWDKRGRRDQELWDDLALRDAKRRTEERDTDLPVIVDEFLEAGIAYHRRREWRKRGALGLVLAIVAIAAVVFAIQKQIANEQREQADLQRQQADDLRAVATRQRSEAIFESARGAYDRGDLLESRAKLRLALEGGVLTPSARWLWTQLQHDALQWREAFDAVLYDVDIAPDGKLVAAACQDGAVYLFDNTTKAMRILRGDGTQVLAVSFSPDGTVLATAGINGEISLWNVRTGASLRTLLGHQELVRRVRFSPDGRFLASGGADPVVRVWSWRDSKLKHELAVPKGAIRDLHFSPDSKLLASGGPEVRVWDVNTGREKLPSLRDYSAKAVRFSHDGTRLAIGGHDDPLLSVDAATGAVRTQFAKRAEVFGVRFSPDDRQLLSLGSEFGFVVWDATTGRLVREIRDKSTRVTGLALALNGRTVATTGIDKLVRSWNWTTRSLAGQSDGHAEAVYNVDINATGELIASGSLDSSDAVRLWRRKDATVVSTLPTERVTAVSFSADGSMLASASEREQLIRIWDGRTGDALRILRGHEGTLTSAIFAPGGSVLASSAADRSVRIWNGETGEVLEVLEAGPLPLEMLSFSHDGRLLAGSTQDGTVKLWEVGSYELAWETAEHVGAVHGLSFIDDGRVLATGGSDGKLNFLDLVARSVQAGSWEHGRINFIASTRAGTRFAVAAADSTMRMFNPDWTQIVFEGHSSEVNAVAFSRDGKLAVTGGDDRTVRTWDVSTARPHWRAPALLSKPPRLWSHGGEIDLKANKLLDYEGRSTEGWRQLLTADARLAAESADKSLLCVHGFDNKLTAWRFDGRKAIFEQPLKQLSSLLAFADGCVALTDSTVMLFDPQGNKRRLGDGRVTAIGAADNDVMVAGDGTLRRLSLSGQVRAEHEVGRGITAVGVRREGEREVTFIGYRDGNIEARSGARGSSQTILLSRPPASPVVSLLPISNEMVAAGYANGEVGLWNVADGAHIRRSRLHGKAMFLLFEDQHLYAATDLGSHLDWDLATFFVDSCAVLTDLWKSIFVVWDDGAAHARKPPADHRCSDSASQQPPP